VNIFARVNQVQCKPEIGLTFAAALRSFLRQDPDVIMVGEIRDFETAEIAIKASMTGHLVLSTLHTNDAPGTIGRIVNMGIEPFMVTTSVILVQAQRLVRKICKDCKYELKPRVEQISQFGITPELLRRLDLPHINEKNMLFYKGKGCETCGNSGSKGRMGVYEVMMMSERLRDIILNGGSTDDIRRQAIEEGMLSLRESALRKALTGVTSLEEVVRVTLSVHLKTWGLNYMFVLNDLLNLVIENGASDLHLTVGTPPVIRVDGELIQTDLDVLTPMDTRSLIYNMLTAEQQKEFEENFELDLSYSVHGFGRFRVFGVYKQRGCFGAAF
jgi:type II secretory ATPase GspE/PulE/Tfp pilus assembly ATPase PilB-like protein